MAESSQKRQPKPGELVAVAGNSRLPCLRRLRLTNLRAIRREMAAVYNEARNGQMELPAACRLSFILTGLARVITDAELEPRLAALEIELLRKQP
ncbi:MAG: hypothetical protein ACRESA_09935 [Gammaproteobacteria bacterium]